MTNHFNSKTGGKVQKFVLLCKADILSLRPCLMVKQLGQILTYMYTDGGLIYIFMEISRPNQKITTSKQNKNE